MKQAILLLGLLALSGCGKDIVEGHADNYGQDAAANATLQVTTRGTGDAEVAYPVQVYVFQGAMQQAGEQGSGTVCQAMQTIGSAGQTLNIALTEGTYTVYAIGGASSGATWLGERTISFNIGESGSSASAGNSTPAPTPPVTDGVPAVGDTYQGCYVLASDLAADGGSAELTLLSPTEAKVTGDDDVTAKLATLGAGTISGWDVPTKAQMELIEAQRASISGVTDGRYYLWRKMDGNYCSHLLGTDKYGTAITTNWPTSYDIYLRPVAEVTVAAGE